MRRTATTLTERYVAGLSFRGSDFIVWDEALPGFGEMKVKALASVLSRRMGVAMAEPLVPSHPMLGDVDSPEALAEYQAAKRAYKASLRAAK